MEDRGFVSKTPVHTSSGVKPVEQIRVGDLVLSRREAGGEQAYKRVVSTAVHGEKAIRCIAYSLADGSSNGSFYVADNHPLRLVGSGWTGANCAIPGTQLELADASSAYVFSNEAVLRTPTPGVGWVAYDTENSEFGYELDFINWRLVRDRVHADDEMLYSDDPRLKIRVYDFEVEDFHTYFVGNLGAWVHT